MFGSLLRRFRSRDASAKRHSLVGSPRIWQKKRDFQIAFLKQVGLRPEHSLVDVGCGTLRGGLPLIDYLNPGNYFGVEVRPEALSEARSELRESGLEDKQPTLVLAEDYGTLELGQECDYFWAFGVLIHMEDEILREALGFVSRHLGESGVFYANVRTGEGPDREWQGFPIVNRSLDFYRGCLAGVGLTFEDIGSFRDLGHEPFDEKRMLKITRA